jgi:hypoxanthine phosphoribosyltransferase
MKQHKITWEQYNEDIHKLAKAIKESNTDFHCIYAVPRGGLVIGVHLSHLLKLPLTEHPYGNILIVDEISDTGKTLKQWQHKKYITAATLHIKKGTMVVPDYWIAEYPKDIWIIYPWEE